MAGIQEDLFELIQTLSVTEKRYFKVFASGSNSTDINYVVLFDVLCDLDYYDEKILLHKLRNKLKDTSGKDIGLQLNQGMQYLYKVLLQAMRQYKHKAIHIQIRDMTSDAILLRDRGLYKQADKRIGKAKELAKKYHNYVARLELNRLERSLIWSLNEANEAEKVALLIAEKEEILEVLREEMEYEDLYARVSHAINRQNLFTLNDPRAVALIQQIEALFSQKEVDQLSAFAKLRRFQIGSLFNMAEMRMEECREYIDHILHWWETYEYLKEEEFFRYQISLSKILTFFFSNGQHEEMMQLINKIREDKSGTPGKTAFMFRFTVMYELLYYLNSRKIDAAKKMLPEIKEGLNKYPLPHKRKITIFYNIALVCFCDEDYLQCESWLLKIIALSGSNIRKDLVRKAYLLRVILLEENVDAREKAIRAATKYFKEDEESKGKEKISLKNKQIEMEILMLIKKILNAPATLKEQEEPLRKLLEYLESMASNPQSRRLNGLDEFIIWCRGKLGRKSVRAIFAEGALPYR